MLCAQVAVNVGCPTDEKMVNCLKSKDAATLVMKSPIFLAGTADSKPLFLLSGRELITHQFMKLKMNIEKLLDNFFGTLKMNY